MDCFLQYLNKYLAYHLEYSKKVLESFKYFKPTFLCLLIKNDISFHMDLLHVNIFYLYLVDRLLNLIMHLFFLLLMLYMDN